MASDRNYFSGEHQRSDGAFGRHCDIQVGIEGVRTFNSRAMSADTTMCIDAQTTRFVKRPHSLGTNPHVLYIFGCWVGRYCALWWFRRTVRAPTTVTDGARANVPGWGALSPGRLISPASLCCESTTRGATLQESPFRFTSRDPARDKIFKPASRGRNSASTRTR